MLARLKRVPWPALLNLPLAAVLGYALTRLFLPMPVQSAAPLPEVLEPAQPPTSNNAANSASLNIQPVLRAHLFGQANAPKPAAPTPTETVDAPETRLQLTLQGTLLSDDKSYAKAIIAPANGEGKEYGIGKLLPGGATLHDIHADKVILQHQRRLETLSLVNEKAKAGAELTTTPTANLPSAVSSSDQRLSQSLRDYRQRILDNPAVMTQMVRIRPAKQQGRFVGYQLRPGRDAKLFQDAGLKRGDILTHVNGTHLDSPMKGLSALQNLAEADFLDLQVLRNNTPMQFSFSLR